MTKSYLLDPDRIKEALTKDIIRKLPEESFVEEKLTRKIQRSEYDR